MLAIAVAAAALLLGAGAVVFFNLDRAVPPAHHKWFWAAGSLAWLGAMLLWWR